MTATRKGARKKAARKSAGLRVTGLTGTEAAIRAMSQAKPPAKPKFNPVPDETMEKIMADVTGGLAVRKSLINHGVSCSTFFATVDRSTAWAEQYARARASMMDSIAEELLEIQDEEPPLRVPSGEAPGDAKADAAWVTWQKNRIDTRKWLLAKLAPKRYGDRVEQVHSGGETPVEVTHSVARPQLDTILALARAMKGGGAQ